MMQCLTGSDIITNFVSYNKAEVILDNTTVIITSKPNAPISGILTRDKLFLTKDYTYVITVRGQALSNENFAFLYPGDGIKTIERKYINSDMMTTYEYVFIAPHTGYVNLGILFSRSKTRDIVVIESIIIDNYLEQEYVKVARYDVVVGEKHFKSDANFESLLLNGEDLISP